MTVTVQQRDGVFGAAKSSPIASVRGAAVRLADRHSNGVAWSADADATSGQGAGLRKPDPDAATNANATRSTLGRGGEADTDTAEV